VNFTTWMMTLIGLGVGLLAGMLLSRWRLRPVTPVSPQIPRKWPLIARGMVTASEAEVWRWLRSAFHDHLVMIKTPVLRFTIPMEGERHKSRELLEMLNGVYTTFTVCTTDGTVVGCVDVPGKRGLPQSNQAIKEALLSDCSISYAVVGSNCLPKVGVIRAAFLGEIVDFLTEPQPLSYEDSTFQDEVAMFSQDKIRATKESAQRQINHPARSRSTDSAGPVGDGSGASSRFPTQWQNSFIEPLETKPRERR